MQIIEPLVNHGEYVEQHDLWYLAPRVPSEFRTVNSGNAHGRFLQRWARVRRIEFKRALRDAREQFIARMEEI